MCSTRRLRIIIPIFWLASVLFSPILSAKSYVVNTREDCIEIQDDYKAKARKVHEKRKNLYQELAELRQQIDVSIDLREWLRVGEEYRAKTAILDKQYSEIIRAGHTNVSECYRILRAQKLEKQRQQNVRLIEIKNANDEAALAHSGRAIDFSSTATSETLKAWSKKAATHSVFGKNVRNLRYIERMFVANSALNSLERVLNGDEAAVDDLSFSLGTLSSSAIPNRGISSFITATGLSIINSVYQDLFKELDKQFSGVDSSYETYRKGLLETTARDTENYRAGIQSGEINRLRASIGREDLIGQVRSTNRDWFHENTIKKAERARIRQIAEQQRLQQQKEDERLRLERERLEQQRIASEHTGGYRPNFDAADDLFDDSSSNYDSGSSGSDWGSLFGDVIEAVGGAYLENEASKYRNERGSDHSGRSSSRRCYKASDGFWRDPTNGAVCGIN